ncbi:MAG TPA: NAD(P)-dependent oxidoreductase [Saprospiraceae bacterium]|nr:NAD(P)-dependent oxidoreductase [Saprospiraceae bacterium]
MKTLLITGANGFIGSTLVECAIQNNYKVTAAIRKGSDLNYLKDFDIDYLEIDYNNKEDLNEKFSRLPAFDYIIHNAGITKAKDEAGYHKVNVGNTKLLVETLIETGKVPHKFLFVSSLAAVGPVTYGKTIQDDTPGNPVTWYGRSKLVAENYFTTLNDFPWVIVRPTAVYGPKDKDIFVFIKMICSGFNLSVGYRDQELSFIHSEDLVALMLEILRNGQTGKKYIGYDLRQYTSEDLSSAIKEALHKKAIRLRLPVGIISMVAFLSEKIGKLSGKIPALNIDKVNELKAQCWWCNSENVKNLSNWQPKYDLYSGMKQTIAWYKDKGWL